MVLIAGDGVFTGPLFLQGVVFGAVLFGAWAASGVVLRALLNTLIAGVGLLILIGIISGLIAMYFGIAVETVTRNLPFAVFALAIPLPFRLTHRATARFVPSGAAAFDPRSAGEVAYDSFADPKGEPIVRAMEEVEAAPGWRAFRAPGKPICGMKGVDIKSLVEERPREYRADIRIKRWPVDMLMRQQFVIQDQGNAALIRFSVSRRQSIFAAFGYWLTGMAGEVLRTHLSWIDKGHAPTVLGRYVERGIARRPFTE